MGQLGLGTTDVADQALVPLHSLPAGLTCVLADPFVTLAIVV